MKTVHPFSRRIRQKHLLHFQIGLLIAMAATWLAFQWTLYQEGTTIPATLYLEEEEMVEQIPQTVQRRTQPPPPVVKSPATLLPEDLPDFSEQPPASVDPLVADTVGERQRPAPITSPRPSPPAVAPPVLQDPVPEGPIIFAERMPVYGDCQGTEEARRKCTERNVMSFVQEAVEYPGWAHQNGIEGTVYVRFVIDAAGQVTQLKCLRDPGGGLCEEAMRVVRQMERWEPGRQRGRPVSVYHTLPVRFTLE